MAGGPFAAELPCYQCLGEHDELVKATRVYEGSEDDHYECEKGHRFGIDWTRGAPETPQWPPPAEVLAAKQPKS